MTEKKPYYIDIDPPDRGAAWWTRAGEFLNRGRWFWRVYSDDPQVPDPVSGATPIPEAVGYAHSEKAAREQAEEWAARHRRGQYTFDPEHRPTRIRKATFRPGGQRFDEPDNL